jgi:hypothetical protein
VAEWPNLPEVQKRRTNYGARERLQTLQRLQVRFHGPHGHHLGTVACSLAEVALRHYLLVTARKGISSVQLAKEIGITQKSAWFVLHRLREACGGGSGEAQCAPLSADNTGSFYAVLKRGLYGIYHRPSARHMSRYVNEVTFRLNEGNAKRHTLERLDSFVDAVVGKRITYKDLTGTSSK